MLREDTVRFGQLLSLACAPSSLAAPQNERQPQKVTVEFTGLTGPHGPMPLRLTEFIRNRLRGIQDPDAPQFIAESGDESGSIAPKDSTLADFLDLFHHRMIALFYRAWAVAQKTVDFDREEDRSFAEWIASLAGLGLPELDGQDSIPSWEKLPFTGHLACQTRHAGGLESILAATFSTQAKIYSFTGHWISLPEHERCNLGVKSRPGTLGRSCVVGARIWDQNLKFTVHLGPISLQQFSAFLPGASCHRRLHDWIDFYTSRQYYWKVVVLLKKEEVPKICLGRSGQLGYTSWLGSLPFTHDPGDYQVRGGGLTAAENS
jgi:type VI secretion system protein ImpH